MNTITETPSVFVLVAIVVVISLVVSYLDVNAKLFDKTLRSALLSAIFYIVIDSVWRGISPFIIIGFGDVFLLYLPLAFVTVLAGTVVLKWQRRKQSNR